MTLSAEMGRKTMYLNSYFYSIIFGLQCFSSPQNWQFYEGFWPAESASASYSAAWGPLSLYYVRPRSLTSLHPVGSSIVASTILMISTGMKGSTPVCRTAPHPT